MDLPLEKFSVFRTTRFEVARRALTLWRRQDVQCPDPSARIDFRIYGLPLGWMNMAVLTFGCVASTDLPRMDVYAVVVALAGRCEISADGQTVAVTPGRSAVLSAPQRIRTEWSRDCVLLIFTLDQPGIEAHAIELWHKPMTQPLLFDLEMDSSTGPGQHFVHEVLWPTVREVEQSDRPFEDLALIDRLPTTVMTELLKSQPSNYLPRGMQ